MTDPSSDADTVSVLHLDAGVRRVVAGRYVLGEQLGGGGGGNVFRAQDPLLGRDVAVKLLHALAPSDLARARREAAALRLLRLPGVVQLIDQGDDRGTSYIVMEVVEGSAFPGGKGLSWEQLAPTTEALLETLEAVHAAGIVHRDLKPSNVLVSANGAPTILDFGLSAGPALGERVTRTGVAVGTPAYFAPEQWKGARADHRTDLYAVGLMLYEALSGSLPHVGGGYDELVIGRTTKRPDSLATLVPDLPPEVVDVIDRLLSLEPSERPQSAREVLSRLEGTGPSDDVGTELPRLGSQEGLSEIVRRARSGLSTSIAVAPGHGASRLIRDVSNQLVEAGATAHTLLPGRRAFESLAALLPGLERFEGGLAAVTEFARKGLVARLRPGEVLLIDRSPVIDRWTEALLESVKGEGAIVRLVSPDEDADLSVGALGAADLEPLFWGPERVFHLPSDAAQELFLRTDGVPARVEAEVRGWVGSGLALWRDGALKMDRSGIDRLRAGLRVGGGVGGSSQVSVASLPPHLREVLGWMHLAWPHSDQDTLAALLQVPAWVLEADLEECIRLGGARLRTDGLYEPRVPRDVLRGWSADQLHRAHVAIAAVLPSDSLDRLFHLGAAGETSSLASAAMDVVARSEEEGLLGEAEAALTEALAAARSSGESELELKLLEATARIALARGARPALDRALYELGRAAPSILERTEPLEILVRASLAAMEADAAGALELVRSLEPFDDLRTERWRQNVRARAASRCDAETSSAELKTLEAWATSSEDPEADATVERWLGLARYREADFAGAAALHLSAAEKTSRVTSRLAALLNAASAWMEAGEYEAAAVISRGAREEARERRHPLYEARATWLERCATFRGGASMKPDPAIVDVVARLGVANMEGLAAMNEAAIARASGDRELAVELATRAADAWRRTGTATAVVLCSALSFACGDASVETEGFWPIVAASPVVDAEAIAAALVVEGGGDVPDDVLERARASVSQDSELHQGLLSVSEMREVLSSSRD